MLFIATTILIIVYGFGLIYSNKNDNWRIDRNTTSLIKRLHYTGLLICILVLLTYINFHVGLRGIWTTRLIIIFTLITGIFFIFFANKTAIGKFEWWYFKTFSILPILTLGTFIIPYLGIMVTFTFIGQLTNPSSKIYFNDDKLRIQLSYKGILVQPKIDIFEKKGFFERHLIGVNIGGSEIDSLNVFYDKDSTRIKSFIFYGDNGEKKVETRTISIEKMN